MEKLTRGEKIGVGFIAIIFALFIIIKIGEYFSEDAAIDSPTQSSSAPAAPKLSAYQQTPEYQLLSLDKKTMVDENDPDLERMTFYLNELAKSYQMTKEQIADMTWTAEKDLKAHGIFDEPVLVLLEKMWRLSKGKDRGLLKGSYATVLAIYLTQRER